MARLIFLTRGFLVDCLRRTALIAVLVTILLHGFFNRSDEGVSLFYFSGVAFSCALLLTLAAAVWHAFTRRRLSLAIVWLTVHGAVIGLMIPFYATLMAGLTGASRSAETLALLGGLNTFFIVVLLRATGEQLYERLQRSETPHP